jgi:hypothetical protein
VRVEDSRILSGHVHRCRQVPGLIHAVFGIGILQGIADRILLHAVDFGHVGTPVAPEASGKDHSQEPASQLPISHGRSPPFSPVLDVTTQDCTSGPDAAVFKRDIEVRAISFQGCGN